MENSLYGPMVQSVVHHLEDVQDHVHCIQQTVVHMHAGSVEQIWSTTCVQSH